MALVAQRATTTASIIGKEVRDSCPRICSLDAAQPVRYIRGAVCACPSSLSRNALWVSFSLSLSLSPVASRCFRAVTDMMSAAPAFMRPGIDSVCAKTAKAAAATLPRSCAQTAAHVVDAAAVGCAEIGHVLAGAAHAGDCRCLAAIAFADAAPDVRALHRAERPAEAPRTAFGSGVVLIFLSGAFVVRRIGLVRSGAIPGGFAGLGSLLL